MIFSLFFSKIDSSCRVFISFFSFASYCIHNLRYILSRSLSCLAKATSRRLYTEARITERLVNRLVAVSPTLGRPRIDSPATFLREMASLCGDKPVCVDSTECFLGEVSIALILTLCTLIGEALLMSDLLLSGDADVKRYSCSVKSSSFGFSTLFAVAKGFLLRLFLLFLLLLDFDCDYGNSSGILSSSSSSSLSLYILSFDPLKAFCTVVAIDSLFD